MKAHFRSFGASGLAPKLLHSKLRTVIATTVIEERNVLPPQACTLPLHHFQQVQRFAFANLHPDPTIEAPRLIVGADTVKFLRRGNLQFLSYKCAQ